MRTIAVIGLGYVGLGLAIILSKHHKVYGYDISEERINSLRAHIDRNQLESAEELTQYPLEYVAHIEEIKNAEFYIVAVSTPAYYYQLPDLDALTFATKQLASILKKGDIVVYESTVYPGATEEVCLPILEEGSHLHVGIDFNLCYSYAVN